MSFVEKIQYKDELLNKANINQNISMLWGKALPIFMHRKYLQDRFTRKYDQKDVVVALEYYISIIASGYFGGKEPQFKVKNINETQKGILNRIFKRIFGEKNDPEDYQAIIDYIAKYNDNGSFFYDCVLDYITTGKYNPAVYRMSSDRPDSLKQREIHFLNGSTAKMQAGYFSATEDTRGQGGYNIYYYCDECLSDNASVKNKHLDTCATTFL